MRKSIIMLASFSVAAVCSCGHGAKTLTVTNSTGIDRKAETVEVCIDSLGGIPAGRLTVWNSDGVQIPSQIVGGNILVFQADVKANSSAGYVCRAGKRMQMDTMAYSRHVPERMDDYAYENNLVAGRIYGPALSDPRTFGPDIWLKSTDRLVIDKWFALADYHHDHGEGLDCYKVANTLGGGACAPVYGEHIAIGNNWASMKTLCSGPVRTAAEFVSSPFKAGEEEFNAERTLTLDANTRLVKWTVTFSAAADSLDVVLGAVLHDVVSREDGNGWISFTEKASDSSDPERDGNISVGLVLESGRNAVPGTLDGHAVLRFRVGSGEPVTYWTASGWSKGGVGSPEEWNAYMKEQAEAVNAPLAVKIEK